jgi:hypothetical protein
MHRGAQRKAEKESSQDLNFFSVPSVFLCDLCGAVTLATGKKATCNSKNH